MNKKYCLGQISSTNLLGGSFHKHWRAECSSPLPLSQQRTGKLHREGSQPGPSSPHSPASMAPEACAHYEPETQTRQHFARSGGIAGSQAF